MRFRELWKRKHETGQWVEIGEAEAMPNQSDFSTMNASGIMLSNALNQQKEFSETSENDGRASIGANAGMCSKYDSTGFCMLMFNELKDCDCPDC